MLQHMRTAHNAQAGATAPSTSLDATNSKTKGDFSIAALPDKVAGATTSVMRWNAHRVGVKLAAPAAGQVAPVQVNLRDSTTGAGNILDSWQIATGLSAVSPGVNAVDIDENNLDIPGIANQAMTLEFSAAPVAASTSSVFLQGFADVGD